MTRGAHFDQEHQRNAAKARTQTTGFHLHNQEIASDGPAAQSAYLRARKGSSLLDHWHAEFLFLNDYAKSIDQSEQYTETEKRWLHGWHVWHAIWDGLNAPPQPTQEEFMKRMEQTRSLVSKGYPLPDPLAIVYVAPDDFCDGRGHPLRKEKQRKCYRSLMERARTQARAWSDGVAQQRAEQDRSQKLMVQRKKGISAAPSFVTINHQPSRYKHRRRIKN